MNIFPVSSASVKKYSKTKIRIFVRRIYQKTFVQMEASVFYLPRSLSGIPSYAICVILNCFFTAFCNDIVLLLLISKNRPNTRQTRPCGEGTHILTLRKWLRSTNLEIMILEYSFPNQIRGPYQK